MRIRTFQAADIGTAMQHVREALGEDAIILSTHESSRGRGVQITAGIEEDVDAAAPAPDAADAGPAPETAVEDSTLWQVLSFHGLPDRMVRRLCLAGANAPAADALEQLAAAFDHYYDFQPLDTIDEPILFVGPPGSGKTIAAAKTATRLALGGGTVNIVTTDTVRAGAIGQLKAYADILSVNLSAAHNPRELADIVAAASRRGAVVIDTPGTNPFDPDEMADLKKFLGAARACPVLVLAAGGDVDAAGDMARKFAELGCRHLLMTRLDAARRMGSMLVAAEAAQLALTGVSISGSVAQNLKSVNPMSLARVFSRDPLQRLTQDSIGVHAT